MPPVSSDDDESEASASSAVARVPDTPLTLGGRHGLGGVLASLFGTESPPESFGRYQIVRRLGAGAFGEVYEALDTTLARAVAVKILRPLGSGGATERLRREARAMAAVDDPGLVKVFEVGTIDGRDFIAMELVRGTTLQRWAHEHSPGTRDRFEAALRWLVGAGAGLSTAHARRLIHRDFKPANVLVGDDGTAKVADFGLARDDRTDASETDVRAHDRDEALSSSLTRTGAIMGTPRYMAPEQHRGGRADASSDQFGFAVTAWEVVFGVPPFAGRTSIELLDAIDRGPPVPPVTGGVPGWFAPLLQRALAADPAMRFESMTALLAAIGRASRRRRRLAVVGLGVVGGLGVLGWVYNAREDTGPRCDPAVARAELDAVWTADRRDAIGRALRATGVPYAETTAANVGAAVDAWGERWIDRHVGACRATWHDGVADETLLDRRVGCLREGLATADALVARLGEASPKLAERALAAVDGLPDPRECESPESRAGTEDAAIDGTIDSRIATARAAHRAGDYATAIAIATASLDEANGGEATRGDALFVLGLARGEQSPGSGAEAIEHSHAIAMALDQPRRATRRAYGAATERTRTAELEAAAQWLRHAEASLARVDGSHPELEAGIARAACQLHDAQGRPEDALVACRRAIAVLESAADGDASQLWHARMTTASTLLGLGRHHEARAMLLPLHDEAVARLGALHPRVGGALMNLGLAAQTGADLEAAAAYTRRAIEVFVATYGPEHAWVVSGWLNLGAIENARDDLAAAELAFERALAIAGPHKDARTARVLMNLAEVRRRQGRFDEALARLDQVADIEVATIGADHIQTAHTHQARALVLVDLGRFVDARTELDRVLALRANSPSSPDTALALAQLSRLDGLDGELDAAIGRAVEAERIYAGAGTTNADRSTNLLRLIELSMRRALGTPAHGMR